MPCWYYFARPSNMACHNLCTTTDPPMNFRALLGLGLNFCPKPRYTNFNITEQCTRFTTDIYTKSFMAPNNKPIPRLFKRSDWRPPSHLVNYSLQRRTGVFLHKLKKLFIKRKVRSNLLPHQRTILGTLRKNKQFLIIQADKNLGPCIIERDQYIKRALKDHLLDTTTYRQLTPFEKHNKIHHLQRLLNNFIDLHKQHLPKEDVKFLKRSASVTDPLPKFYLTAKVHKTPWKTRPIVSLSGSLLHGLGQWTDKILQPFVKELPSYVQSSFELKELLLNLPPLPSNAILGTCDAVTMYTNIDTVHALSEIRKVIRFSNKATTKEKTAVLHSLDLIMKNNIFEFGDTTWLQIDGTAMGVSPSCCYAMLYFSPHEEYIKNRFPELYFYKRYIDDVFYIWIPQHNPSEDTLRWSEFCQQMNSYGKLRWEFSNLSKQQNFLDLMIYLKPDGTFETEIYEKAHNPYLYLPSHSTHPSGSLKGLIYGSLHRIIRLTSSPDTTRNAIQRLYHRLLVRGYDRNLLTRIRPQFTLKHYQ